MGSTVVEHLPHQLKVEASSPATAGRKKTTEKVLIKIFANRKRVDSANLSFKSENFLFFCKFSETVFVYPIKFGFSGEPSR